MASPLLVVLMQAAMPQAVPPVIVSPPHDAAVRPDLRSLGNSLQHAGHCARFIPADAMDKLLLVARAHPEDEPYLIRRIGAGSRAPESIAWCNAHMPL